MLGFSPAETPRKLKLTGTALPVVMRKMHNCLTKYGRPAQRQTVDLTEKTALIMRTTIIAEQAHGGMASLCKRKFMWSAVSKDSEFYLRSFAETLMDLGKDRLESHIQKAHLTKLERELDQNERDYENVNMRRVMNLRLRRDQAQESGRAEEYMDRNERGTWGAT